MKLILSVITVFLVCSCNSNKAKDEIKYYNAIVIKTTPIHWGHGYYKQDVRYSIGNGDKDEGVYRNNGLSNIYSLKYNKGDSVVVKIHNDKFSEGEVVKLFYIKKSGYHENY